MMNKNRNSAWLRVKGILVPVAFVSALALTSFTVEMGVNQSTKVATTSQTQDKKEKEGTIKFVPPVIRKDNAPTIYQAVEEMPYFGKSKEKSTQAVSEFLAKNTNYPTEALDKKIKGTIYVSFTVKENGEVTSPKVIRGINPLLDNEAIRVVKLMPRWTPGKQKGKPVSVSFTIPFRFDTEINQSEVGNQPKNTIILVNGMEYNGSIKDIPAEYIEKMNIIKKASEISKYGERGKNGIFDITLKEGKSIPTPINGLHVINKE